MGCRLLTAALEWNVYLEIKDIDIVKAVQLQPNSAARQREQGCESARDVTKTVTELHK